MNDLTTQPLRPSIAYSATAELTVELAKMLALVAPTSMSIEQQELWLRAAVDSLEDIRPAEVAAISAELRRSVTRPAQIVPEIAKLVSERRNRSRPNLQPTELGRSWVIAREAQDRRAKARGRVEIEAAWQWERQARLDAGLSVPPIEKPLGRDELANMPAHIAQLGLAYGFLERVDGQLVERQM